MKVTTSTYSVDQEREINLHLKRILETLGVSIPEDHFGMVEISFPRQHGKIAGEIEVKLRSTHVRQRP
jgi:hypothetical protein